MHLGSLPLDSNLFLSPLAGYTSLPFRLVVREIGGVALATTDLVNARSLLEKRQKAFKLIETRPEDRPLAVQLFGSMPEEMRDAAALVESLGYASVDINMGCPAPKVCKVGGGSAMMSALDKTAQLAKDMVAAVKIPVTAKMRLGWDDQNITAPDLARALADAGVAAVFVHGRTRAQGFGGTVNLAGIRAVVQAVSTIPVIGNGDVTTPAAAKKMLEETGCAGVSIGRGAFYDPWIFQRTLRYLPSCRSSERESAPCSSAEKLKLESPHVGCCERGGAHGVTRPASPFTCPRGGGKGRGEGDGFPSENELLPEPSFDERVRVMCRHLDLMIEVFGEEHGCRIFRKVAPWYAKRFGPSHQFNKRVVLLSSRAQFRGILDDYRRWRTQFLDEQGELQPRFRPLPMIASFMQDSAAAPPAQIPVPKGPVEVW